MRYFYRMPANTAQIAGETYECDHPVYSRGTLFTKDGKGLVIIQQRYNPDKRITWWTEIDPWLATEIFKAPLFGEMFDKYAEALKDGLYPTITVRQAMALVKIKPLQKERWETMFDRKPI